MGGPGRRGLAFFYVFLYNGRRFSEEGFGFVKKGEMRLQHSQPLERQFWRYALPSMFSQLLNSFFIIVDGFFIGQNLGDTGLAAINVAWPLVAVIQAVSLAIGTGGAVRLATAVGAGDTEEALKVRGNTIIMLLAAALLLGFGFYFSYPALLPMLGANEQLYPLAAQYMQMVCFLSACQIFTTGLLPILRGMGRSVTAMVLMVTGLLGNIFLDWLCIQYFHWGMSGAALATGAAQGVCALFILPILLFHKGWPVRTGQFVPEKQRMLSILHHGISPFGLALSTSILILLNNLRAMRYGGTEGVAVYAVLSYVLGSVMPLVSGVGDGIQPLLSRARGAGLWDTLHRLQRKGLALAIGVALVCSGGCWLLRDLLPLVFGASPSAAGQGSAAMWTLVLAFPFMAVVRFSSSYFCAVSKPAASSLLAYAEPLGAQPLFLLVLPLFWGLTGVWLAYPAAVILMAAVSLWLLRLEKLDEPFEE